MEMRLYVCMYVWIPRLQNVDTRPGKRANNPGKAYLLPEDDDDHTEILRRLSEIPTNVNTRSAGKVVAHGHAFLVSDICVTQGSRGFVRPVQQSPHVIENQ